MSDFQKDKISELEKDKISEFEKEIKCCIKPLSDYIQSAFEAFAERLRYAVINDGLLRSVHVDYDIAKCFARDNSEIWIAFVNKDNSVSMLAKTDYDWRAK